MAVTVTYLYPVAGTTPPTAAQGGSFATNSVIATILPTSNTDASAIITHAMNLPAADITAGWPSVLIEPLDTLAATSNWTVTSQNPNWTVITKNNTSAGADTVAQIQVRVDRVNTGVR